MTNKFIFLCCVSLFGCSGPTSSTDIYEETYSLDEMILPTKDELNQEVNTSVALLFTQNPVLTKIEVENRSFDVEQLTDKSIARVVGCFTMGPNSVEQIELLFVDQKLLYLRQDVFEGENCQDASILMNVEKNYFYENQLVHQHQGRNNGVFLWKSEQELQQLSAAVLAAL
ncbi:hypothetical protein SAMN05216474_1665 [Lishizhenia tianjinensis]|uniref:Lipoprotein n=1 Tax=Lishizhenia tianjinensis TaxID=477690 RepID=A0A1I6ZW94_9FLAO|nr:hypothetical protein [Lishizhenia tianjinensis]SFT66895.1 hypothetical protein SAMN05216474_1665 [Lishizhenia tianjinensis]